VADINQEFVNKIPRFREAFETNLACIRAVPEDRYPSITVDVQSSVATLLGAWKEIRPLRAEIVEHLPTFDIALFDKLEPYTLALGHAQTEYKTANEPQASLVALGETVAKTREILIAEVNTLIVRGIVNAAVLNELKGANGYKNTAFDVFALSNILKNRWDAISTRTSLTRQELDEAENQADLLVTRYGEKEQAPVIAAQATRDRLAAFTLVTEVYEEVRAAIGYLRRKHGDADSIAPSLYVGRSSTKKNPSEATTPTTEAAPAAATPAVGALPTATTTQQPNQTSKSHVETVGPFV
jgi:hypothetical protein